MTEGPDNSELISHLTQCAEFVIQECHKDFPVTKELFPSPWLLGQEEAIRWVSTAPYEELARIWWSSAWIVVSIREENGGYFKGPQYSYYWKNLLNFLDHPKDSIFEQELHNFGFYAGYILLAELAKYPILTKLQRLILRGNAGANELILRYSDKLESYPTIDKDISKAKARLTKFIEYNYLRKGGKKEGFTKEEFFSWIEGIMGEVIMKSKFSGDLLSDLILVVTEDKDINHIPYIAALKLKKELPKIAREAPWFVEWKNKSKKTIKTPIRIISFDEPVNEESNTTLIDNFPSNFNLLDNLDVASSIENSIDSQIEKLEHEGYSDIEIGQKLGIHERTVRRHKAKLKKSNAL